MSVIISIPKCSGPKDKCQTVTAFAEMPCIAGAIFSKIGAMELIYI